MEASLKNDGGALDYDIVRFYTELDGNDIAKKLIIDTLKRDLNDLKEKQKTLGSQLKALKEKR